ncbi:MAG: GNAT family N-acetyltransferase [Anaerolineae bacterium]|jgi:GNAT superfamily N-acetyltransferase|nr:GNAT family N-acetyltransferase [Anaerolineae bacterium]
MRAIGTAAGFAVRVAGDGDAGRIATLSEQLGYPTDEGAVLERLHAIGQRPDHAVFVAEAKGNVVGWVHVYAVPMLESPAHAEIGGLVVDEAHRGRGIGRALMARAEAWARDMGLGVVRLRSNVIRAEAHAFYEHIGYAQVKTQKVFAKTLEAAK